MSIAKTHFLAYILSQQASVSPFCDNLENLLVPIHINYPCFLSGKFHQIAPEKVMN
jgi:hypothetical protein